MAASAKLIVICSPEAVASAWVDKAILEFASTHDTSEIFCCIVDGEAPAVFPASLLNLLGDHREPLAADFRPTAKGRRGGLITLIAGVVGVGYDELQQRETHRRHQRMAIVSAASIAGMLLTSWLAWNAAVARDAAEVARQDAEQRRQQAEDLIGFMLGDLRTKLEEVGRLDLLENVGDKAMDYFQAVSGEQLSDIERTRLTQAMHQIGEVRFRGGNFGGARNVFERSLAQAQVMFDADPEDSERTFQLSQAHYWVGFAAWYQGSLDEAQRHWQSYFEFAEQLRNHEPGNRNWQVEFGFANSNLDALARDRRDWPNTQRYLTQAAAVFEQLANSTDDPEMLYEYAASLSWLGSFARSRGQLLKAHSRFSREIDILTPLVSDHDNAHWLYSLALAHRHLGEVAIDRGQLQTARVHLELALSDIAKLREAEPRDTQWRFGETVVRMKLSRTLRYSGEPLSAEAQLGTATVSVEELLSVNSENPRWQVLSLDLMLDRAGNPVRTMQFANARAIAHRVLERTATLDADNLQRQRISARAQLLLAETATQPSDRRNSAARAMELLDPVVIDSLDPDFVIPHIRARLLADRETTESDPQKEQLRAMGWGHPELF